MSPDSGTRKVLDDIEMECLFWEKINVSYIIKITSF
jgi:hypothetical protein